MLNLAREALDANVAVVDGAGVVVGVNDRWRRFGESRNATSDYVGTNYLDVCSRASDGGDHLAARVERGLRALLTGQSSTFGLAYRCGDRMFRMVARPISQPVGGLIIAHTDITALLQARRDWRQASRQLSELEAQHLARAEEVHEEINQRLTAISLAVGAIERGNVDDSIALIRMAVEEARNELRLLRYEARQSLDS